MAEQWNPESQTRDAGNCRCTASRGSEPGLATTSLAPGSSWCFFPLQPAGLWGLCPSPDSTTSLFSASWLFQSKKRGPLPDEPQLLLFLRSWLLGRPLTPILLGWCPEMPRWPTPLIPWELHAPSQPSLAARPEISHTLKPPFWVRTARL